MKTFKETLEWGTEKCTKEYKKDTPGEDEVDERYNNAADQYMDIQNVMKHLQDFMVNLDRDDNAPDVKRVKRKLKNIQRLWKDVEQSLGPFYMSYDYPTRHVSKVKQKKFGTNDYTDDLWG